MKQSLIAVATAVVLITLGSCSSGSGTKSNRRVTPTTATTADQSLKGRETAPPWPVANRQADRIAAAGLPRLTQEGSLVHFHARLVVFHNGDPVKVPSDIGIDFQRQVISPLHTHDDTGLVHVEAEVDTPVTLGQLLIEWGVRIDNGCIGDICPSDAIALYVNGAKQNGPVTEFELRPDLEIALVLGTPPATIPSVYKP